MVAKTLSWYPHPSVCPRPLDVSSQGYNNWIFMSTHFWDEDPQGLWILGLQNKGYYFNTGEKQAQVGGARPPTSAAGSAAGLSYPTAEGSPWDTEQAWCTVGVQSPGRNRCPGTSTQ